MYWIEPHEHFYEPGTTNSSDLYDTQTFNRPPAVAEFQRRWLQEKEKGATTENPPLTTASESNGVAQPSYEQTATIAASEATTDIEIMEVSSEISSNPMTDQMTLAEPTDRQRDNRCDNIATESASSIAQRRCAMRLRRPSTRKAPTNRYR